MIEDLLKIELRLLVLRYGRKPVLNALAALGEQTVEGIEADLKIIEERKVKRKPKMIDSAGLLAQLSSVRPDTVEIIQTLVTRYENRTFLPQLREVQRFLDRVGSRRGRLRSRRDATPEVIKALAQLSEADLKSLATSSESADQSDFALLAHEIMGGRSSERDPQR